MYAAGLIDFSLRIPGNFVFYTSIIDRNVATCSITSFFFGLTELAFGLTVGFYK